MGPVERRGRARQSRLASRKLITKRHNNFATVIINAHIRETNMRFIRDRRDALASFAASLLIPALNIRIQLTGGDYVDPVMFPPFILRSRGRMMNLFHGRGSELLRLRDSAPCNHSRFSRASFKRVPPSSERSTGAEHR
jgi:hypothetical protein